MDKKKLISIITPCYNEEDNIVELCDRISVIMNNQPYNYEHICIDNSSTDTTVQKIKNIANNDKCLKLIINSEVNHISPMTLSQDSQSQSMFVPASYPERHRIQAP